MTNSERIEQVLLSSSLGPIVLLWGIVEDADGVLGCECKGKIRNCKPGKHPRMKKYKMASSADPAVILDWSTKYPFANFGILTGFRVVALDADIRPEEDKNGVWKLELLESNAGKRIPRTVISRSGRNNGSYHLFFLTPNVRKESLGNAFADLEYNQRGYVVAPGSRHPSGFYYRFEEESDPNDVDVAEMPDFILAAITKYVVQADATVVPGSSLVLLPDSRTMTAPGKFRADWIVIKQMKTKAEPARLLAGTRKFKKKNGEFDRSRDDYRLFWWLAFYTSHHVDQAIRIFKSTPLYGARNEPGYVEKTCISGFVNNPQNWKTERKWKSVATGTTVGRSKSPLTLAVLNLHKDQSELTPTEIAQKVACSASNVRKVLHRLKTGFFK